MTFKDTAEWGTNLIMKDHCPPTCLPISVTAANEDVDSRWTAGRSAFTWKWTNQLILHVLERKFYVRCNELFTAIFFYAQIMYDLKSFHMQYCEEIKPFTMKTEFVQYFITETLQYAHSAYTLATLPFCKFELTLSSSICAVTDVFFK